MNHTYLQYWQQTTDNINLLTNLVKTNIEEYQRTQDIEYIEYILGTPCDNFITKEI